MGLQEEWLISLFLCRTFAPSNQNNGEKIAAPRGKIYGPTGNPKFGPLHLPLGEC